MIASRMHSKSSGMVHVTEKLFVGDWVWRENSFSTEFECCCLFRKAIRFYNKFIKESPP